MPVTSKMIRSEIRKLARQGILIDSAFLVFQAKVYPGVSAPQIAVMRTAFFAGAAEVYALMMAGLDDGLTETGGDLRFMEQWTAEIERVHARTIAAVSAGGAAQ